MDRAEDIADKYIDGRLSCEVCPDLMQMIDEVRTGQMSREEFVDIIRYHLDMNNKLEKVI